MNEEEEEREWASDEEGGEDDGQENFLELDAAHEAFTGDDDKPPGSNITPPRTAQSTPPPSLPPSSSTSTHLSKGIPSSTLPLMEGWGRSVAATGQGLLFEYPSLLQVLLRQEFQGADPPSLPPSLPPSPPSLPRHNQFSSNRLLCCPACCWKRRSSLPPSLIFAPPHHTFTQATKAPSSCSTKTSPPRSPFLPPPPPSPSPISKPLLLQPCQACYYKRPPSLPRPYPQERRPHKP